MCPRHDIVVFNRYLRQETFAAGIEQSGCRPACASNLPPGVQQGANCSTWTVTIPITTWRWPSSNPARTLTIHHFRRSYVCKVVTRQINKLINLPVLKHHQSAGVNDRAQEHVRTGMVNNVNRHDHLTLQPQRLRHIHSLCGEPAGDPRESRVAYLRRCESVVSRGPRRPSEIHLGAQDHVFRDRSGGARQDRVGRQSTPNARRRAWHPSRFPASTRQGQHVFSTARWSTSRLPGRQLDLGRFSTATRRSTSCSGSSWLDRPGDDQPGNNLVQQVAASALAWNLSRGLVLNPDAPRRRRRRSGLPNAAACALRRGSVELVRSYRHSRNSRILHPGSCIDAKLHVVHDPQSGHYHFRSPRRRAAASPAVRPGAGLVYVRLHLRAPRAHRSSAPSTGAPFGPGTRYLPVC